MNNGREVMYVIPNQSPEDHTAAIQDAVEAAKRQQINVVVIGTRADGAPWHLSGPVKLPSYFTVILSGCRLEAEGVAFVNEAAYAPVKTPANEAHKIFILGRKGAVLQALSDAPQICLYNARDCRVAGLTFVGGDGIDANHLRYSKLQQLICRESMHALTFREGCNNIIVESVDAQTREEAIRTDGGSSRIPVREPHIGNSILCRIRTKTRGAAALALLAGEGNLYNVVVRDITDDTEGPGASVVIGHEKDAGQIRDLTVRGVRSNRDCVHTMALCDGNFYSNLHAGEGCSRLLCHRENTRQLLEDKTMEIVLPQFREELPDRDFVTANDPRFFGEGDAQTIQNAVDYAQSTGIGCVVIPCLNHRTGKPIWEMERCVRVPSDMTVVFLHCHLRHQDFMYENLFSNSRAYDFEDRSLEKEEHDLCFTGVGDAVLDGGKPNGLKEKTCFLYGYPDKRLNATVLFNNVRNMVLENFQIRDSRWYGMYYIHCDTVRISNIDFDNGKDECNRDGVDIRQGNHNFLVENITGVTSDDTVALNNLGNDGNDGRYVRGKDCNTMNVVVRNVKSDAGMYCFNVRLLCQDRHLEHNFLVDTVLDVSSPEDQAFSDATVMVGSHEYHYKIPAEIGDMAHLTIRDVYSRAVCAVALGGCSDDVDISNVHTYADGISVFGVRASGSAPLIAHVRDVRASGLFYRRDALVMNQDVANPVRDRPAEAISLQKLETINPVVLENVFVDTAVYGVKLTGQAQVQISNLQMTNVKTEKTCGAGCCLYIDGKEGK